MSGLAPYLLGCSACTQCEGAAYQLPPFLYAGSSTPTVLVMAQNPGEIKEDWRLDLSKLIDEKTTGETLKTIYDIDFITSHGHKQMTKIFGDTWLTNGKFMYTNAVRCRTKDNAPPSNEMIENCLAWTYQLPIPQIVILMGKIAVKQFCTMVGKSELPLWRTVKLTRSKSKVTYVTTMPHYSAMRSHSDFDDAKRLFEKTLEDAEVVL
jgi:uracil-DNA glycosylase